MRKHLPNGLGLRVCSSEILAFAILVLLLAVSPVLAQLPTGTILGAVKDASGGAVPDAQVTLTQLETGTIRTATTGSTGEYRVPALQPGHYSVKVEKSGFKTMTQSGLTLDVAAEITVNANLEVGTSTQQVTVTGEAPLVETTTSSLGGLVNDQQMAELPLNGRNFIDLALLQPGITNDTNYQHSNAQGGNWGVMFSSNGAPVRSNTVTLDGTPLMSIQGVAADVIGDTLGVDGIKEYKVITNSFSAEYGLDMGSQVVIVSKGGSNQFHGDVFEFLRNSAMDARNFFDYSNITTGKRLPILQRNNFGGSFGGPIKKDKTFFYGVYEGLRQNQGATTVDNVFAANCHPLPATPNQSPCATSTAAGAPPVGTIAPAMIPLLALFPSPNLPNNQFTYPADQPSRVDYGQIRVDHNFSANDSMFARYTIDDSSNTNAYVYPQFQILSYGRDQFLTLAETHIFSPTLLNTARASYSRPNLAEAAIYPASLIAPQYSLVPGQATGTISVGTVTTFGTVGNAPYYLDQNTYSLSDDVYYTKGRHAFKFGALWNRFEQYTSNVPNPRGTLSFANVPAFLAGLPTTQTYLTPGSMAARDYRFYTYGFYAQDDWRVTSHLTLNLGLRYEFNTTPLDRNGFNYAFVPNVQAAAAPIPSAPFRNPSFKNFGPRVGFAWDVFGNGKTSVRSAFGEYYDVGNFGYVLVGASAQPPLSSNTTLPTATVPVTLPIVAPGVVGNSLHTALYDIGQPHALQWNLTIEQQLAPSLVLSVAYVGTRGLHLWNNQEGNPCIATSITNGVPSWANAKSTDCPLGRVNPLWGTTNLETTNSDSWYNGLQTVVTKRLSHGLEVQGAFTYSKNLDDTEGEYGPSECQALGGAEGVYSPNPKLFDKGPSCFNATLNLRVHILYHFPTVKADNAVVRSLLNGWWMGALPSWQTGEPFTPIVNTWRSLSDHLFGTSGSSDHVNVGTATVAPGQMGPDGTLNTAKTSTGQAVTFVPYNPSTVITGNPQQWYNPLMFIPGPIGSLGNASRDLLEGPHLSNIDFSVSKDTTAHILGESGQVEFRAEFFNIFNRANFGMPNGATYAGTLTDTSQYVEAPISNAGTITNTITNSRQIQLSLKLIF